jgi:hypothetical protein
VTVLVPKSFFLQIIFFQWLLWPPRRMHTGATAAKRLCIHRRRRTCAEVCCQRRTGAVHGRNERGHALETESHNRPRGSVDTLGATLQNAAPACPPPWPMACIRYYGVVPRDAGSWVGLLGVPKPTAPHATTCMHACSSLRGAKVRVTTHNHACLTFTGRGMPVGRHRADVLRSTCPSQEPIGRPYEPTAQSRDPPPAPNVQESHAHRD